MKSIISYKGLLLGCLLLVAVFSQGESKRALAATSLTAPRRKLPSNKDGVPQLMRGDEREVDLYKVRGGSMDNNLVRCLMGSLVCGLIEQAAKKGFAMAKINFPSSLGGCISLFFALLLIDAINPSAAEELYTFLAPSAAFLAKWMVPLFVPGLVMLPLSPSVGGTGEILKIIITGAVGCMFTTVTSTYSVLAIRTAQGKVVAEQPSVHGKVVEAPPAPKPKPFNDASWKLFSSGAAVSAVASIWAAKTGNDFATPLETIFLVFATILSYISCANLPAAFTKLVHPLATGSALTLAIINGYAKITGQDYFGVLRSYRVGTLDPMTTGAGDILMFLLGAPVVAFAVSVYSRRQLLFNNLLVVMTSMLVASAGSLFATAGFVRLISVGVGSSANMVRLSLLARNITTALALPLTSMLGGDLAIAASMVCLTGILGGTYGRAFLDALGIKDPISRGLGMGCSAQGLGVAAMAGESDAFPFAAIAMVLTAIAATTLGSIPSFKNALIKVACGSVSKVATGQAASAAEAVVETVAETVQQASP